ncbi:peptidase family M1 protein [Ceratobasidium sp. AG-Ba]|nr:peptidase family M1 protein [Ceratobasidium sp. AG-Ba]
MDTDYSIPENNFHLPRDVGLAHCQLFILTDLKKLTFSGVAIAHLDILVDQLTSITLNSSKLSIDEKNIAFCIDGQPMYNKASLTANEESEQICIKPKAPIANDARIKLIIPYEGKLSGSMTGYYVSYAPHNDTTRPYALTQFEPTSARCAFPCWDEPSVKATYSVTMVSRQDTVALSNMSILEELPLSDAHSYSVEQELALSYLRNKVSNIDDWKITHFNTTPLMSSYLVAFANGHFRHLESSYVSPLSGVKRPLRIYATSDIIHQAQFALEIKAKVLPIYERKFDIEYPLSKLDTLVAHDFDSGAMENWGLITGRTNSLLYDEKGSNLHDKQNVAATESHECAHMWFGDIVTMNTWSSLWLKEGFATIVGEVIVLDEIFPEWNLHTNFFSDSLVLALELDAKRSSHPINIDSPDPKIATQLFDSLSYSKAASVLRMLSHYVGNEAFLLGASKYLKKRLYANADPKDLWEAMAEVTGTDISQFIDNWVSRIGFPLLTVTEAAEGIYVRQDRFLSTGDATEDENKTIWNVPLFLMVPDSAGSPTIDKNLTLTERETFIPLDTSKPWKINAGAFGVYRVAYSNEHLRRLGKEASRDGGVLSLSDRAGLVSDATALASAGYGKTSGGLEIMLAMRGKMDYLVWNTIADHLDTIESVWWEQPAEVLNDIRAFREFLFKPVVDALGYEYSDNESPDVHLLRTLAIRQCASASTISVVKELRNRFQRFMETGDEETIPVNLQRTTYRVSVQYGTRKDSSSVKKIASEPPTPSAKVSAMLAMTKVKDEILIQETLQHMATDVKDQDLYYYFIGLSSFSPNRRLAATFFKENYSKLYGRLGGNMTFVDLVKRAFEDFTSEEDARNIEKFFEGKDTSKFKLVLAQSLESIRAHAKWLSNSREDVADWLASWRKDCDAKQEST